MASLILGSTSPRRKEILEFFSLPFIQEPPFFDENSIPFDGPLANKNPAAYVTLLSQGKAFSLKDRFPDSVILTADTVVYKNGQIYGKPENEDDACRMLSDLVGKWHTVYTGVTIRQGLLEISGVESTDVLFNALSLDQIKKYIKTTLWTDKAGGYAIQSSGGLIVRKIDGCYYNVMGLPINTVHDLLLTLKIDLWDCLRGNV